VGINEGRILCDTVDGFSMVCFRFVNSNPKEKQ